MSSEAAEEWALEQIGRNKYYEHIPHITNRITGQPAPVMTRATEEKLRNMFKEVQAPFIKHCPPDRKKPTTVWCPCLAI